MDNLLKDETLVKYFIEELNNSFTHHKHLVQQVNNFIAFYLTFTIGSISISATFLEGYNMKGIGLTESLVFISVLFLNMLIGSIILSKVIRNRYAISRHREKIRWIRAKFYAEESFDHDKMCGVFDQKHPALEGINEVKKEEFFVKVLGASDLSKKTINEILLLIIILFLFIGTQSFLHLQKQMNVLDITWYLFGQTLCLLVLFLLLNIGIQNYRFIKYTKDEKERRVEASKIKEEAT